MKILKWTSLMMVFGLLASCYPEKDRTIDDFDLVGTNYDDSKNFGDYKTYYLHDSLILVYDTNEDKPDYPVKEADAVLGKMKENLLNYGWIEVTGTDTPDVYLEATTWNSTVTGAVYYPGYGYPGYGYPGYGWGYPGYGWGGTSYYQYTTGTVVMYMMDVKNYTYADTPPDILWTGGINGVLTSGSSINRIEFSIDQAFKQSAYLNKK